MGAQQTTIDANTGKITATNSEISSLKQSVNGLSASVSSAQTTLESHTTQLNNKADLSVVDQKINSIEIGGRNLLVNSNKTVGESATREFIQFADLAPIIDKYGLIEYTISFDIKSKDITKTNLITVYLQNGSGSKYQFSTSIAVNTKFERKSITVIPTLGDATFKEAMLAFFGTYNTGNIPIVRNVKVEKGNKNSDYTQAPEDVQSSIDTKANITDVYNKTEVYTKAQTDSQINVAKDSITQSVSSTYATKTDVTNKINGVNTTIANLTNRVSTAESKITDSAITNVVKQNFYTKTETDTQITNKGYQTASQVQQTVDSLQLKFTQSGGYNMLKNGKASLSTAFWASNGGGISRVSDSVYKTCFKTTLPNGMKYVGGDNGGSIRLKNNTHYVYEAMIWSSVVINGSGNTPLHFWCNTTAETSGQAQCTIMDYSQSVPTVNKWIKCYVHFQTKVSGEVWFKPIIYASGIEGNIWVTELSLSESLVQTPYSPHPSEIYDGITTIDKDGIKVATTKGAYTHFSSEGMNSYDNNGNQTLGIRNGGLTFHAWNNHEYIGYISQSAAESNGSNGISIGMTSLGEYISLGVSTKGADVNVGFAQSHYFVVASKDIANATLKQGLNAFRNLYMNKWSIFDVATAYFNEEKSSAIWEAPNTYNLCAYGKNGVSLGYKDGDTNKGLIQLNKSVDDHDCRITLFSNLNLNGNRVKNGQFYYDNYARSKNDFAAIFKVSTSSESQMNVEIGDDYTSSFNIQANNWKDGGRYIARFNYEVGTTSSSRGIDFFRALNMNNYNITNVGNMNVYAIRSEELEVNDIRVSTSFPVMSRSGRQTSLSVTKSVDDITEANGTVTIVDKRAEVNLPEGLLFTEYFVQITANKLVKLAVTEKNDDYFVIETDSDEEVEVFYTIKAFQPIYVTRSSTYGELRGEVGESTITYAQSISQQTSIETSEFSQKESTGTKSFT